MAVYARHILAHTNPSLRARRPHPPATLPRILPLAQPPSAAAGGSATFGPAARPAPSAQAGYRWSRAFRCGPWQGDLGREAACGTEAQDVQADGNPRTRRARAPAEFPRRRRVFLLAPRPAAGTDRGSPAAACPPALLSARTSASPLRQSKHAPKGPLSRTSCDRERGRPPADARWCMSRLPCGTAHPLQPPASAAAGPDLDLRPAG